MIKHILREILIWLVIILIVWIIWFPIHSVIPYKFLPISLVSHIILIHFARWFVFYDNVLIFKNPYLKVFFCCAALFLSFVIWSEGQKIMALMENMELKDIMHDNATPIFLKYEETYNLFHYLRNLLVIGNYGTPGIAFTLVLKIVYRTLGMDKK